MDARLRRVNKEIAGESRAIDISYLVDQRTRSDCKNDQTSKVTIDLVGNSPYHLIGSFDGPEGTPYEGGHYKVVSLSCSHTVTLVDQ
jgi:ubiquitin-conjugating enzyme (huntingtin interacting protein 2)